MDPLRFPVIEGEGEAPEVAGEHPHPSFHQQTAEQRHITVVRAAAV
jgi:hypothetical protein